MLNDIMCGHFNSTVRHLPFLPTQCQHGRRPNGRCQVAVPGHGDETHTSQALAPAFSSRNHTAFHWVRVCVFALSQTVFTKGFYKCGTNQSLAVCRRNLKTINEWSCFSPLITVKFFHGLNIENHISLNVGICHNSTKRIHCWCA